MDIHDQDYWDQLYLTDETRWDIGYPSTPLKEYMDQLSDKKISILIPGSGNSYEAIYLLKNGFSDITVLDISSVVTKRLADKIGDSADDRIQIVNEDFFNYQGNHDLILEQTFFCALDPSQRVDYVRKMKEILKPGGKLAGVLFNRSFEGGPPFGGEQAEYEKLFHPYFPKVHFDTCYNSIPPRAGTELFFIAQKLNYS